MQATLLSSARNPLLQRFRRALRRGELTPDGCCVVEGEHLVQEAFNSPVDVVVLLAARSRQNQAERLLEKRNGRVRLYVTPDRVFQALSETETPQGLAALVRLRKRKLEECVSGQADLVAALVGLQDPGNLGTVLRSLEAFGGSACLLGPHTVSPFNAKAVRASAGSLFRIPTFRQLSLDAMIQACRRAGILCVGLVPRGGDPLAEIDLRGPVAFFVGNEAGGLDEAALAKMERTARIPLPGPAESLNAAVAASLAFYEAARQRSQGN